MMMSAIMMMDADGFEHLWWWLLIILKLIFMMILMMVVVDDYDHDDIYDGIGDDQCRWW